MKVDQVRCLRITKKIRELREEIQLLFSDVVSEYPKSSPESKRIVRAWRDYDKVRSSLDEVLARTSPEYRENIVTANSPYRIYGNS